MVDPSGDHAHTGVSRRELLRGTALAGLGALATAAGTAGGSTVRQYNVGTATRAAEEATKRAADRVERVMDWGDDRKTVAGRYAEQAAENLRNRPDVRYVERDGEMHAFDAELDNSWGVDRVDADVAHADGVTGDGADVAIIDTGIDSDHPDLQANLGAGYAVVSARGPYAESWDDDDGHGTHCAGIADALDDGEGVVGVSTAATLHAVKVLDNSGSGSFSDVAEGIRWVADQGYDVGSLSLGASSGSQAVADACEYADGEGVLLVAAAGNSGPCTDCVGYPAAYPEVVAVSATDRDDSLADYSSTGPAVDLAAPGTDVYSTYSDGGYAALSGTSMACPHVSGAGGLLMASGQSSAEARSNLTGTAEDVGLGDSESGAGLLDAEAAAGTISGDSGDSAPSVSWANPADGDAVSGTVTVRIDASDGEDSDDSLAVTYSVDGGAARSTTYDSTSGYYEDSWDTTAASDGDHTLEASATDSAGNTSSATVSVTTDNTESTNTAPSATVEAVTDSSNPAWQRFTVDWSVADDDGNLDSVVVELLDSGGSVLDSVSTDVGGSSASGSDEVRAKSTAAEVAVTATDTDGVSGSDTQSV